MITSIVNGEEAGVVSPLDRGLLYGDGVFETLAIRDGRPCYWSLHMARLREGCRRIGLQASDEALLREEAERLAGPVGRGVLKLVITRGEGGRGYQVPDTARPTRIVQLHPWPEYPPGCAETGVATRLCHTRLGCNPVLAGMKHLNRMEQVLARQEWDDPDIREGLMQDRDGNLVEGIMSNLFLVKDDLLVTPDLSQCGVAGISRSVVLELAENINLQSRVRHVSLDELMQADEILLTNSIIGIWPVIAVDARGYRKGPITRRLQELLARRKTEGGTWRR